jgi:hypothetical protein
MDFTWSINNWSAACNLSISRFLESSSALYVSLTESKTLLFFKISSFSALSLFILSLVVFDTPKKVMTVIAAMTKKSNIFCIIFF